MVLEGPTLEFCVNNVNTETRQDLVDADLPFLQQHCLRHCGLCHEVPFVVRDGEVCTLESHDALVRDRTGE